MLDDLAGDAGKKRRCAMMEYPFFLYKEKPGAVFGFSPKERFPFGRSVESNWPSHDHLERCEAINGQAWKELLNRDPLLAGLPAHATETKWRCGPIGKDGRRVVEDVGVTVKIPVQERERLFGALLGVAQKHGLSLADPLFGVLWATPAEEERRANVWMRVRRPQLLDDLERRRGRQFCAFHRAESEMCYGVVEVERHFGKASPEEARRFRGDLRRCLWPGERMVPFPGRLVVEGPGGVYRFHFNWEGCGNHAQFTADFREEGCPIVELGRSSMGMLRRTPSARSLVAVGMEHPAVAELVPDPAERYTMLHFANRKLEKRLPRALVAELKAAKAEKGKSGP